MKIFDFLASGFNLGLAVGFVVIFFFAFFNGAGVLITINDFGEQWIEAVLFPIWIVMGIITLIRLGRKIRRG